MTVFDLEICDCHHHLWDLEANYYPWLVDTKKDRVCGDYEAIRNRNFLVKDFLANRGELQVTRFIHEEAVIDRSDPVRETRWLQGIADSPESGGIPHGIVAFADFGTPDIQQILEAHCVFANTRGIRQFAHEAYIDPENPKPSFLQDSSWRAAVGLCRDFDLVFDLQIYWQQADDALKLLKSHSELKFVLTHIGLPAIQDDAAYMEGWRTAMKRLAEIPNLSVKLSGFGMFDRAWSVESIRPIVLDTIEWFGAERCLFGSNFPVDSLSGKGYVDYWKDFYEVVADFSMEEKQMLFSQNARAIYRV